MAVRDVAIPETVVRSVRDARNTVSDALRSPRVRVVSARRIEAIPARSPATPARPDLRRAAVPDVAVSHAPEHSLVRDELRPTCKERPRSNRPRGGKGGSRRFIPWCG